MAIPYRNMSRVAQVDSMPDLHPARSRRMRRAVTDRDDLIDAICEVIAERGYENTRFSDVAARASTSIGSLQYFFGSREDMIVLALETRTSRYLAETRAQAASIADPVERLRWVATYLASNVGDPSAARLEWLVWTEYWRAALRDQELRDGSVALYGQWLGLVRESIDACVRAGVFPPPADPDAVAAGAVATGDGLGIQITLGHPGMTRERAGEIMRSWLAAQLGCPALAEAGSLSAHNVPAGASIPRRGVRPARKAATGAGPDRSPAPSAAPARRR